jgi:hypothetical protein
LFFTVKVEAYFRFEIGIAVNGCQRSIEMSRQVESATALETGREKGDHERNRLSGPAGFSNFGAHFFHLDFILAQHGGLVSKL